MENIDKGIATSSNCPRGGQIWLKTPIGNEVVMDTNCKTWGCKGCRDRIMSLFKARVEVGCSALGRCAFMTVTYKADSERLQNAECVTRDWKALWRHLKSSPSDTSNLKWLRVMEVTKRMTPHHHLVMGPIDGKIRCWSTRFDVQDYKRRLDSCVCLAHVFARSWRVVTKDSWIVHTVPVTGAAGASSYMAKYLTKSFGTEARLASVGMSRRWSSSRGWPGSVGLKLAQTDRQGWIAQEFHYGRNHFGLVDESEYLKERAGSDLMLALADRRNGKRVVRTLERIINHD